MRTLALAWVCSLLGSAVFAAPAARPLLQTPTVSKTEIAFAYGGDIWIVPRQGGVARRLVAGEGGAQAPRFSPDGALVAFTGNFDDNDDVYVVPSSGGEPKRLTYHPGRDAAIGWTPDGANVLIRSHRDGATDSNQLFTVPVSGASLPKPLPLPTAEDGSFSPDGARIAYSPYFQWEPEWRHYRGGQTTPIWIARLSDSSVVKVPRENSNDRDPMWLGDKVYFLSDRSGPFTLFSYDPGSGAVAQLLKNDGFDIASASAGPDAIVYAQGGGIHLLDPSTGAEHQVEIRIEADRPRLVPRFVKVGSHILNANLSPTGARALFEAHGEIFTVPAEKGGVRDISHAAATADRDPAWSPDGKWIAYFSDESGEYALHIRAQDGLGTVRKIDLGRPPSFFYSPVWSPDSKKICYSDKRLNLWYVDVDHPSPARIDTDLYDTPLHEFDQAWSPDSRWIAYTKQLPNHLRAVFVYSIQTGKVAQLTDGMSDALSPNFDRGGKYLFFTASTDVGLSAGWLDMSSDAHPMSRAVYAAVLQKGVASPVPPESDEEKTSAAAPGTGRDASGQEEKAGKKEDKSEKKSGVAEGNAAAPVVIDFSGILQRIVALPIAPANYLSMNAGKEGQLYLLEAPVVQIPGSGGEQGPPLTVQKFDLKTRKTEKLIDGVSAFVLSADGERMLYRIKDDWFIAKADAPAAPGKGGSASGPWKLNTEDMELRVDPRAEWRQMYREAWRIERDFFYDPHHHGLNLAEAEKAFESYVEGAGSRSDLTAIFHWMFAYLSAGHMWVRGGARPDIKKVSVGMLGADYTVDHGRYRFAKVYSGENWNPKLEAPLTRPGVDVRAGEYLISVNGRELRSSDNIYEAFQETAGRQTAIRVGPSPDGNGSRDLTVVPIGDDYPLRRLDWIEGNRRKVDQLSGGRLAYVYLPDTAAGGYTNFNRYFFAQVGKEGAILDERYNHGGQLADYVIDHLRRPLMSWIATREGDDYSSPGQAIYGPKAMIINRFAGSGGDAMPWYFRKAKIGPLVGTRTWGGLIGIGGYPQLLDGGSVMAPRWAIYGTHGEWEVENHGVAPDIEVEQDPKLVREGHDPQLEKAVAVLLEELKEHPLPKYKRPRYPDYHPSFPGQKD